MRRRVSTRAECAAGYPCKVLFSPPNCCSAPAKFISVCFISFCFELFSAKEAILKWIMKVLKCNLCPFQSTKNWNLKSHKVSIHSDLKPWKTRDFLCTLCPSRFYDKYGLDAHIRNQVKEKVFEWKNCQFKTHDSSGLPKHVRSLHNKSQETIQCSFLGCNYSTSISRYLKQHLKSHNPGPLVRYPVPCTYLGCEYRATISGELRKHTRRRHNPNRLKDFLCNLCPKTFYSRCGVNCHVKLTHLNETDFKCEKCDYATSSLSRLKIHRERVHYDGFAYSQLICKSCGYRGSSLNGLAVHMGKIHHHEERKIKRTGDSCKKTKKYRQDSGPEYYTFERIPLVLHGLTSLWTKSLCLAIMLGSGAV